MNDSVVFQRGQLSDDEKREKEEMMELEEGFKGAINFDQVSAEDIAALVARLARLLAEEADLLEQMQVSKIAPLQREKRLLTNALEVIKKRIPKDGSFMAALDDKQREDLQNVTMIFNEILEENYARLNTARLVNKQVVNAITEVVSDRSNQDVYDDKGKSMQQQSGSLSISIDEKI